MSLSFDIIFTADFCHGYDCLIIWYTPSQNV